MTQGDQNRIPFDVLEALPDLEEFHLSGSQIKLEVGSMDTPFHPSLHTLRLTSCKIQTLPSATFGLLRNITELHLDDNLITNFTSDAFKGLTNLETLTLSNNPLKIIPPRAFVLAPNIRHLYLNKTCLGIVPRDAFYGLRLLELITFAYGNNTIEFESGAFSLPKLRKLAILATPTKALPPDLLHSAVALEEFTIQDAGLNAIPKGFLKTLQRLQKLDLSINNLRSLDSEVFQHLNALSELVLSYNDIEELPSNLFYGLHKLKSVIVNHNRLKNIDASAFDARNPITILNLDTNLLTSEALYNLDISSVLLQLKELHLRENRLSYMVLDWQRINALEKLDLSQNNFTELDESDLLFDSFNVMINLRENHITSIRFNSIRPVSAIVTWTHKTSVFLGDNPFKCDCELYMLVKALYRSNRPSASRVTLYSELATCASPPNLAGTLLQNLQLSSLTCPLPPKDCPQNCTCDVRPATKSLELDCQAEPSQYPIPKRHDQETTKLRLRSTHALTLPSHVRSLNLTGLGLKDAPLLHALKNIQELDLTKNKLTEVPLELLKTNMTIRLAGNPFVCDCSHLDNIYNVRNYTARILDVENVTCSGWGSILLLDPNKLCEVRRAAVLGGSLAALGVMIAVISGFAYRFSLEIKVFLFSRGWCQRWVAEDDIDDAVYDAFVSFSQEDAQWVAEHLLHKLEGEPHNYKLCVHYRDWVVGDMIPAQIATSIEQSRRTIVVLTKNFLESTWAPLEFRAANIRAQRDRHRVLIVVLEEIPECEEMDAELRAYLTTNTYLKWGDPWFWEKLMYAMPHKRNNNVV